MTHREIAKVMGITRQGVWFIEQRAMEKLRQFPENLRLLRALSQELEQIRARKQAPETREERVA